MGYFGEQTYNSKEREFVSAPLQQIADANKLLSERYETVKGGKRALSASVDALKTRVDDKDKPTVDEAIQAVDNRFKTTVQNDDFENAGNVLNDATEELNKNDTLKYSMKSYNDRVTHEEALSKRLKMGDGKGGLNQATINYAIAKGRTINNKRVVVDKDGKVSGMYTAINPVDDVEWTDKLTELVKDFRTNTAVNSNSEAYSNKKLTPDMVGFVNYVNKVKATGATEEQLRNVAAEYLSSKPEYTDWLNQQADMKLFYQLQHDANGNPIYDKDNNLSYAPMVEEDKGQNSSAVSEGSKYQIASKMYDAYSEDIDKDRTLNSHQKAVAKQSWLDTFNSKTNEQKVDAYRELIKENIASNHIRYAGRWKNYGVEREIASVDWSNANGQAVSPSEVLITNTTGNIPITIDGIAESLKSKYDVNVSLNTLKTQYEAELAKGKDANPGKLQQMKNEMSVATAKIQATDEIMNDKLKYVRNDFSDKLIKDAFNKYVTGNAFNLSKVKRLLVEEGSGDEDMANLITAYRGEVNNVRAKMLKGTATVKEMNDIYNRFTSDMYATCITKFGSKGIPSRVMADAKNFITSGKTQDGTSMFAKIADGAQSTFANTKHNEAISKNVDVIASNEKGDKEKDGFISVQDKAYQNIIKNSDMYVVGSNVSINEYVSLGKSKYTTWNNKNEDSYENVDLAKSDVTLASSSVDGKKLLVVTLRNSSGDALYDNANKGKGDARPATIIVAPGNQSDVTSNMLKRGDYLIKKGTTLRDNEYVEMGIKVKANANWGDISAANPEMYAKGRTVPAEIIHGSTGQKLLMKFTGLGEFFTNGKNVKQFRVDTWDQSKGRYVPLITKTDASGKIVNDEARNLFTSDQQLMRFLETNELR